MADRKSLCAEVFWGGGTIWSTAVYLFLAAGMGLEIISAARKRAAQCALVELLVLFFYTFSYILGYADVSVLKYNFVWTFGICVPIGFTILCMNNLNNLYQMLYKMAKPVISILCGTIVLRFIVFKTNQGQYDESLSYVLLFWCIILCNSIFEKLKIRDLFFVLCGLSFNLLWGSRGIYLCFAMFVLLKIIFDIDFKKRKTLIFLGGGTIVLVLLALFLLPINFLGNYTDDLVYFRSLSKILNGEMFQSDSRIRLYILCRINYVKTFFGMGGNRWMD